MPELPLPTGPFRASPLFSNTGQAPWLLAEFKVLGFNPPFDRRTYSAPSIHPIVATFRFAFRSIHRGLTCAYYGSMEALDPMPISSGLIIAAAATTNLFRIQVQRYSRRPSFSPPVLPEAMIVMGKTLIQNWRQNQHPYILKPTPDHCQGLRAMLLSQKSFTTAFLQFVLESLVDDTGPCSEFS